MLRKFLAAAAGHGPVVALDSRKAALEIVDLWLEHAAEYLGAVALSIAMRKERKSNRGSSAEDWNIACRVSTSSRPATHVPPAAPVTRAV
jgi:hypothetical protein